nr:type 4a pilus biogenesis protein PilO [Candidatus Omnitrophota bacterium]
MKKKSEKKTGNKLIIISAIIIALVLAIGAMLIYLPFTHKNESIRADILKERDKNLLIGKIKALSKYIKIYDKKIPDAEGVSWLLSEISNMASKEHIEVTSIKPGNPENYGLYAKLSVIVDVASTYNQLGKLIAEIESSEKFLKVESINMKRMDIDEKFEKDSGKFKAFDIKANIVISTVVSKK